MGKNLSKSEQKESGIDLPDLIKSAAGARAGRMQSLLMVIFHESLNEMSYL